MSTRTNLRVFRLQKFASSFRSKLDRSVFRERQKCVVYRRDRRVRHERTNSQRCELDGLVSVVSVRLVVLWHDEGEDLNREGIHR